MILKLPYLQLSGRISRFSNSHLSSLAGLICIQSNHNDDEKPPNSSEYDSKIHSLKKKLHPEALINVLSSTHDLNSCIRLFKWVSLQNQFQHTVDTYYHIIMRLGMASRIDEMEGVCNAMVKSGFSASEQALLRLLDSFIMNHKFDEALRVFCLLCSFNYKPSVALVNRLLGVLVEEKRGFKSVVFVYKEMVKARICPTTETLNYVMEALFDADRVESVLDQYKRMRKKGCCPNSRTYGIIVSGLIGKNLLDEAIVVLHEVLDENGCDLELKFFSKILPLLFKINQHDVALRLFEKMRSSNFVVDLSLYEVLIHYFSNNKLMDDAVSLLNEMISSDLKASDRAFVDIVHGFCSLNKLSEAKWFLEHQQVTEANPYNVLLKGYCQADNYAEAMFLFYKMVEKNITNSLSWNILISYHSENQRFNLVYKALARLIVSACTPDSTTYAALIVGKCKSSEVQDALNLFHHVLDQQWVLDSSCYNTLIQSLCQFNKIQDAIDVFDYIYSNKLPIHASSFSMLIKGLCHNGEVNKAINLLPLASSSWGLNCSNEDYSIIMNSLSKPNNLLTIFGRMVVEGRPLNSEIYNRIIKTMSVHQRSTECAVFLNQMVNEGMFPSTEILLDSVSFLALKLQVHMILPTIHKLLSFSVSVSVSVSEFRVLNHAICNILIKGLWKEGYKHEARLLLDMILEQGWVPDSATHRLLIGSCSSEQVFAGDTDTQDDEITNILSDNFN